jgi:porphobilinogen synthase
MFSGRREVSPFQDQSKIETRQSKIPIRPRRNRRSPAIRAAVRETRFDLGQLIVPLFVHAADDDQPIDAMPGQTRWSLPGLVAEVRRACDLGLDKFILFPKIDDAQKTPDANEAANPDGLIPHAVRALKQQLPQACIITDIALDPYNRDGHDGLVADDGRILNDETIAVLCQQALAHARAGADLVAPSDMMDGRVAALRTTLDAEGFTDTGVMAYTAKYASAFYGPFRAALDSAPAPTKPPTAGEASGGRVSDHPKTSPHIPGDKSTYQMDPANAREALRELALDEAEGADIVMVKPAGPYLDIIRAFREHTTLPVAAYQVSGEYAMLKAAAAAGAFDERPAVEESLTAIFRAGADMVLTYYATQVAQWRGGAGS